MFFFENFENVGPTGNRSDWLGDPVPGPWGPILGPREWVFWGVGDPQKTITNSYFLQCPKGGYALNAGDSGAFGWYFVFKITVLPWTP